eukprot:CAMPEP_0115723966 /NCGR_PEP_ID=MMETSP0272-20121206/80531_1 /TAXON_ID=71861 /ORGANISM="Scrippsiella trochoidea, Strain CCMP3099" /LENGTH=86 /DNA_ID=CAMNT_0003167167 /DNA_START=94 /DNA_END=351 /DNA_ORIENTATION=-
MFSRDSAMESWCSAIWMALLHTWKSSASSPSFSCCFKQLPADPSTPSASDAAAASNRRLRVPKACLQLTENRYLSLAESSWPPSAT